MLVMLMVGLHYITWWSCRVSVRKLREVFCKHHLWHKDVKFQKSKSIRNDTLSLHFVRRNCDYLLLYFRRNCDSWCSDEGIVLVNCKNMKDLCRLREGIVKVEGRRTYAYPSNFQTQWLLPFIDSLSFIFVGSAQTWAITRPWFGLTPTKWVVALPSMLTVNGLPSSILAIMDPQVIHKGEKPPFLFLVQLLWHFEKSFTTLTKKTLIFSAVISQKVLRFLVWNFFWRRRR